MIKIVHMKYDETLIPFNGDCWVNATAAARHFGKLTKDWLRVSSTKEYIYEVGKELDIEAYNSKEEISPPFSSSRKRTIWRYLDPS